MRAGLLDDDGTSALRAALAEFTVDAVDATLGPDGRRSPAAGDRAGVERALRMTPPGRVTALIRLFLLGSAIADTDAVAALRPLSLDRAPRAGLIARAGARACRAGFPGAARRSGSR